MKKRALGLTDIAIPSVPYERGKMSDDNYEKSNLFFGKDTLDSGNSNSQPGINQIFEKEPRSLSSKEKAMKKKRFLKIKSLKKMASYDKRDQETVDRLKENFEKIDSALKKDLVQKIVTGSLQARYSHYKRGGKIWKFIHKIAQDNNVSSVFTEINSYFDQNFEKVFPKISLFKGAGGDNINVRAIPGQTVIQDFLFNYIFEKVKLDSGGNPERAPDTGIILLDQNESVAKEVRKQKSDIVESIVKSNDFYSQNGIAKIDYIDNILSKDELSKINDLQKLPNELGEYIARYRFFSEKDIPSYLKPKSSSGSIKTVENLEKIYKSLLKTIVEHPDFQIKISNLDNDKFLMEFLRSKNIEITGDNSVILSNQYKKILNKLFLFQKPENSDQIKEEFSNLEKKINDKASSFLEDLKKGRAITNGLSFQDLAASSSELKEIILKKIKLELFNPDGIAQSSSSLLRQYEILSKRFTATPRSSDSSAGSDNKGKKKKKSDSKKESIPTTEAPTEEPTGRMTSLFSEDPEISSRTPTPSEPPTRTTTPPIEPRPSSPDAESLAKIDELDKYVSDLEKRILDRGLVDSTKVKKTTDKYRALIKKYRSGESVFNYSEFQKLKQTHLRVEEIFNYISSVYEKAYNSKVVVNGSELTLESKNEIIQKYRKVLDEGALGLKKEVDYEALYREHQSIEAKINEYLEDKELKRLEEEKRLADEKEAEAQRKSLEAEEAERRAKQLASEKKIDEALEETKRARQLSEESSRAAREAFQEQLRIVKETSELERKKLQESIDKQKSGFEEESEILKEEAQSAKRFAENLKEELSRSEQKIKDLIEAGEVNAARYVEIESQLNDLKANKSVVRLELGEPDARIRADDVSSIGRPHVSTSAPSSRLTGAKNFFVAVGMFATIAFLGYNANDISGQSEREHFMSGIIEAANKTASYNAEDFSSEAFKSIKENNDTYFNQYKIKLEEDFKNSLVAAGFTKQDRETTSLSEGITLPIFERGVTVVDTPFFGEEGFSIEGRKGRLEIAITNVVKSIIILMDKAYQEAKKDYHSKEYSPSSGEIRTEKSEDKRLSVQTFDPESIPDNESPEIPLSSDSPSSGWDDYESLVRENGYEIPAIGGRFGLKHLWECSHRTMGGYNSSYISYKKYVKNIRGSSHNPEEIYKILKSICEASSGNKSRTSTSDLSPATSPALVTSDKMTSRPIASIGDLTKGKYYYIDGEMVASIINPIKNSLSKKGGGKPSSLRMIILPKYQLSVPKDPRSLRKAPFVIEKILVRYGPINPFEVSYYYDTPDFIAIMKSLLSEENVGKIKVE